MEIETITLRQAIERFPALLDEPVTWGSKDANLPILECNKVTLQFFGDKNYRTNRLTAGITNDLSPIQDS